MSKTYFLKLGGSLITDKDRAQTAIIPRLIKSPAKSNNSYWPILKFISLLVTDQVHLGMLRPVNIIPARASPLQNNGGVFHRFGLPPES